MDKADMMKKADTVWKMLDDMHANNPENYDSFIKKTLEEGRDEFKPAEFKFSIHASNKQTRKKYYINMCSHHKVPAPKTDQDPVSVVAGNTVVEDVESEISLTVNNVEREQRSIDYLAVNPQIYADIGEDKTLRNQLVKLAIDYYNDFKKYGLSYDCGVSKKVVGDEKRIANAFISPPTMSKDKKEDNINTDVKPDIRLPFQNADNADDGDNDISLGIGINDNKTAKKVNLISEVSSSDDSEVNFDTEILAESVRIKAKIDFIESMNDMDLEVVLDELVLTTNHYSQSRCTIPEFDRIDEDTIKAKFSKSKVLTVTLRFKDS